MDKVLGIIVAASVIMLIAAVIIPSLVDTLGDTGETSNNLENDSTCTFQIERAKASDQPGIVEERCEDHIDDPGFKSQVQSTDVSCLISGSC